MTTLQATTVAGLRYQTGFGNEFATEALPDALPVGRNSPQRPAYGLYTEQLSGTPFTAPRAVNRRTWLYRIRPAAVHGTFVRLDHAGVTAPADLDGAGPNQLRWSAGAPPSAPADFIDGLQTFARNGDPAQHTGCAIALYAANRAMRDRYFCSADGELLIVPQRGRLRAATELGVLEAEPGEILVLPRGVRMRVELPDGAAGGYVCENFGAPLRLPDLGPIGSNGLANPRDFHAPVAAFEDVDRPGELVTKFNGRLWSAPLDHSPLDVVAWHGNNVPYTYDLRRFNTLGSVSYDHPDPSISMVLGAPSAVPGVDDLVFVVFPPRWLVAEHTFRPPWFHRNIASEFMGLVYGAYDGKADGFEPGGASLHNCMSGHGPDRATDARATAADTTQPQRIDDSLAFMFETRTMLAPTRLALDLPTRQRDYLACWSDLPKRFDPAQRERRAVTS